MARTLKVLILDDHVDVAESLGEILEMRGHEVSLAHCGSSAVDAFKAADFDLGLFDVKMPGMNGVESFIEIKSFKPGTKVLMMSGYADDSWIERALAEGALGLLKKPFDAEDLLIKLDEMDLSSAAA
jgi:two-component system, NtrC family, response regulator HydG